MENLFIWELVVEIYVGLIELDEIENQFDK